MRPIPAAAALTYRRRQEVPCRWAKGCADRPAKTHRSGTLPSGTLIPHRKFHWSRGEPVRRKRKQAFSEANFTQFSGRSQSQAITNLASTLASTIAYAIKLRYDRHTHLRTPGARRRARRVHFRRGKSRASVRMASVVIGAPVQHQALEWDAGMQSKNASLVSLVAAVGLEHKDAIAKSPSSW